jgi:hypothetical protein
MNLVIAHHAHPIEGDNKEHEAIEARVLHKVLDGLCT